MCVKFGLLKQALADQVLGHLGILKYDEFID